MFGKKKRVIVGLTTYYNENLMISMSGVARLPYNNMVLIIHNDNPDTKITARKIRHMGYRGKLYIINSEYNTGLRSSRMAIIDFVQQHKIKSDWFVFLDDDDVLLNIEVPSVSEKHFAIIQNMAVIRTRLIDVLRVIQKPHSIVFDDENVYVVRPHIGLCGTLVRTNVMLRLGQVLHTAQSVFSDIDEGLGFIAPVDIAMWSALNIVAHDMKTNTTPIYMDTVNYIATDIDTASTKYGKPIQPSKNSKQQILSVIAKYDNAVRDALNGLNAEAAPSGPESDA